MAFFRAHQLSIMLFESGMCAMLAVLTLVTRSISPKRRHILANMEAGAAILLLADYCAYVYRGKPGALGYWLVRISNFLVYFFILYLLNTFTDYLTDVYLNEEQKTKLPRGLKAAKLFYLIGTALVIISQFTGLYYTFDENNNINFNWTYKHRKADAVDSHIIDNYWFIGYTHKFDQHMKISLNYELNRFNYDVDDGTKDMFFTQFTYSF